jgi:polyisoprenoid-binding protein YceI
VTIDLASVDTSDSQRDESIRGDSFFNIGAHPTAVFTSSDIRKTGGNGFEARGTLNLHGVAQPVALRFTLNFAGDTVRAQGSTAIDRTRFGVGSGEWSATDQIAGRVPINFAFTARRGS